MEVLLYKKPVVKERITRLVNNLQTCSGVADKTDAVVVYATKIVQLSGELNEVL